MEPIREDGRRCLRGEEIEGIGLTRDRRGRSADPARVERARVLLRNYPWDVGSRAETPSQRSDDSTINPAPEGSR